MEAEKKLGLREIRVGIRDPRQAGKAGHDLVEMLVVAVAAVLAGADAFAGIEAWAKEKRDWLQQRPRPGNGIASHDTFGRLFAAVGAGEFGAAFRRRVGVRRCVVFDQLNRLHAPERRPGLKSFAVIVSERAGKGKTTVEFRSYLSGLPPGAARMNRPIRRHWRVENSLHWCLDATFGDERMRARTDSAAHNFTVMRHFVLNLTRLAPVKRKGGLKVQRLIAATSDAFRAQLLGLV